MSFDPINGWRDAQSFPEKMHGLGERNMWIATQDYAAYKADQALRDDSDYRDAGRFDEDDPLSFFSSRAEDQDSARDFGDFDNHDFDDKDELNDTDDIFGNLDEDDEDDSFSWDEFDAVLDYDPENDFDDDEDFFDDDDDFDSDYDYDDDFDY